MGGYRDRRHPFKKEKKKKNKGRKVQGASGLSQTRKVKADQASAECFYSKKQGYWKRNCPLYQASLDLNKPRKGRQQDVAQGIYMIKPCNFFICDTADWVLDTDSLIHIYNLF